MGLLSCKSQTWWVMLSGRNNQYHVSVINLKRISKCFIPLKPQRFLNNYQLKMIHKRYLCFINVKFYLILCRMWCYRGTGKAQSPVYLLMAEILLTLTKHWTWRFSSYMLIKHFLFNKPYYISSNHNPCVACSHRNKTYSTLSGQ